MERWRSAVAVKMWKHAGVEVCRRAAGVATREVWMRGGIECWMYAAGMQMWKHAGVECWRRRAVV